MFQATLAIKDAEGYKYNHIIISGEFKKLSNILFQNNHQINVITGSITTNKATATAGTFSLFSELDIGAAF